MIILINTSEKICRVMLVDGETRNNYEWQSNMTLAKRLLEYIDELLREQGKTWADISGIGVFEGPGSFTGLRIGMTVMNTMADGMRIPIVGARGDEWQEKALKKLHSGIDEKIVLPFYDRGANITISRK